MDADFWRLTPRLLGLRADVWWESQKLADLRSWAAARATALLMAGQSVDPTEVFPCLGGAAREMTPDETVDFFRQLNTQLGGVPPMDGGDGKDA